MARPKMPRLCQHEPYHAKGWCRKCYMKEYAHLYTSSRYKGRYQRKLPGQPTPTRTKSEGYIIRRFPEHPNANVNGCISEHTLIMSEALGRGLLPDERVHHRNGVRDDNRLENLELWSVGHPAGQRVEDKVIWAEEILERYGRQTPESKGIVHQIEATAIGDSGD